MPWTLALAPLFLCLAPARPQAAPEVAWWESFPPASADLVLAPVSDAPSVSMQYLVDEYGRLTGQSFVLDEQVRPLLENTGTGLHAAITVPQTEVQAFFETLLIEHDFVLHVLRERAPRLLGIESLATQARNTMRGRARFVPREHLARMRDHPAMLISTTVALPHTDVRQLSNALRTLITDANTQQIIPAGNSNSLVLVGFSLPILDLVEMLERIEAESKLAWEQQAARGALEDAEEGEEAPEAAGD